MIVYALGILTGLILGNATIRAWVVAQFSKLREYVRTKMGSR